MTGGSHLSGCHTLTTACIRLALDMGISGLCRRNGGFK
jgi:hypothetical protein